MNKYEKLRRFFIMETGVSDSELTAMIEMAKMWHNPLNFDKGEPIKAKYGWDILFSEALVKEGLGNRFYFKFHDYDMTEVDDVYYAFRNCKNWNKYCRVWKKYAPSRLKSNVIYLLAVLEMTVDGFKREQEMIDYYLSRGDDVSRSSSSEDINDGIDLWVNGEPFQIKSKATISMMENVI